jgi:very-short-patch-repair endonuclease
LYWPIHIRYARELRKHSTPEEKILWQQLRNRKLMGYKFLRQHPLLLPSADRHKSFYIADFYCASKKLIIEVDGSIHALQADEDKARDIILHEKQCTVIRVTNEEVNADVKMVLEKIKRFL